MTGEDTEDTEDTENAAMLVLFTLTLTFVLGGLL